MMKRHIYTIFALTALLIVVLTTSCKSSEPLIESKVEYRYIDRERIDTLYNDRWHTEYMRGDTLVIHDSIDRWHTHNEYVRDTLILTDTVTKTEYVEVEVEKEPTFWEKIGMMAKGGVLAVVLVLVGVGLLRLRDKYITRDRD